MPLSLMPPSESHRATFLAARDAFQAEGLAWWLDPDLTLAEHDFAAFVALRLADATRPSASGVPKTHLWAFEGDTFVGRVAIHHALTDALRVSGGHIGYDIVPSCRGRGLATEVLRLSLPVARSLGLSDVLLTCDDTNRASIRVIEKNGGRLLETRRVEAGRPPKRYYRIEL